MEFYHLMNMRTPFDPQSQDCLIAFGEDYRIGPPVEAQPAPGITPVPKDQMIHNGVVGLYVLPSAISKPDVRQHWPVGLGGDLSGRAKL